MEYYQEITLLPDAETSLPFLWTKVFTQLHIAFADWKNKTGHMDFAVSFPEYGETTLGSKLRLMSETEEVLNAFHAEQALKRLRDYVHLTRVRPVPRRRIRGWSLYSRWQAERALPSRARRYARRHTGVSEADAMRLLDRGKRTAFPPFIQMRSLSSGQRFSLFIQRQTKDKEARGPIGAYGLSSLQTVPEF